MPASHIGNIAGFAWALVLAIMATLIAPHPTDAHGGATEIFRGTSGPYRVVVAATPGRVTTGQAHLSIVVADAATGDAVRDATVAVAAEGPAGERAGPLAATPIFDAGAFEADLTIPVPGAWRFIVTVTSPAGDGAVDETIEVREPSFPWLFVAQWAVPAALLLAIGVWSKLSSRQKNQPKSRRGT